MLLQFKCHTNDKIPSVTFFLIHLCVKEIPTGNDRQLPEVWKAAKFGTLCPRVDLKIQIDFAWFHIPNMETQSLCCHKFVWLWLLHYVLETLFRQLFINCNKESCWRCCFELTSFVVKSHYAYEKLCENCK